MCDARNSMPLEELNFGMGDIFIRLANWKYLKWVS
jgi:hypothetical protein